MKILEIDIKYLKKYLKEVLDNINIFERIFLFLDYDGTLVEIKKNPEDAIISNQHKNLLSRLSDKPEIIVTIVTGRTLGDLLKFFKDIDINKINWVGIHGAEIKLKYESTFLIQIAEKNLSVIREIKNKVNKVIKDVPCFKIEDKKITFAIHFRNCLKKDLIYLKKILNILEEYKKKHPINYLKMKKVIEVKHRDISKENAMIKVKKKCKNLKPSITICIGDDLTDESLFEKNVGGVNIKVGKNYPLQTKAEYFLKGTEEVYEFLEEL